MTIMRSAFAALWREKWLWLLQTLMLAAGIAGLYYWLGLPVATTTDLLLHAVIALVLIALAVAAVWLTIRRMGAVPYRAAAASPVFWLALLIGLFAGLFLPYVLIQWTGVFQSLRAQFASAIVRFTLAGSLFTGALLWAHACGVAAGKEE